MPDFDVNTDESLWELDRLAASGLRNDEVSRRAEIAIGDRDRAAWLVRAWRRRQLLGRLRNVSYWVAGLAIVAGLAASALAANDSPFAPPWIIVVGTSFFGEVAAGLGMLAGTLRTRPPTEIPIVEKLPAILAKTPRRAFSSGQMREMFLNLVIAVVLLLVVLELFVIYPRLQLGAALRERGIETTGTITNKRITIGSHGTPFYSMDFEFTVPNANDSRAHFSRARRI